LAVSAANPNGEALQFATITAHFRRCYCERSEAIQRRMVGTALRAFVHPTLFSTVRPELAEARTLFPIPLQRREDAKGGRGGCVFP